MLFMSYHHQPHTHNIGQIIIALLERLWGFIINYLVVFFLLFICFYAAFLIQKNLSILHDIENIRYFFSSITQSLATIFALITSSSILVYQRYNQTSPLVLRFLPKTTFFTILVSLLLVIVLDLFCLYNLELLVTQNTRILLNLILSANYTSFLLILIYIILVFKWLQTRSLFVSLTYATKSHYYFHDYLVVYDALLLAQLQKKELQHQIFAVRNYGKLIGSAIFRVEKNKRQDLLLQKKDTTIVNDIYTYFINSLTQLFNNMYSLELYDELVFLTDSLKVLSSNIMKDTDINSNVYIIKIDKTYLECLINCLHLPDKKYAIRFYRNYLSDTEYQVLFNNSLLWERLYMFSEKLLKIAYGNLIVIEILDFFIRYVDTCPYEILGKIISLEIPYLKNDLYNTKSPYFNNLSLRKQFLDLKKEVVRVSK